MSERNCPCCGERTERAFSTAPFVRFTRLLRDGADAVERASNEAADGRISGDTWEALHAWLVRVYTELEGE